MTKFPKGRSLVDIFYVNVFSYPFTNEDGAKTETTMITQFLHKKDAVAQSKHPSLCNSKLQARMRLRFVYDEHGNLVNIAIKKGIHGPQN